MNYDKHYKQLIIKHGSKTKPEDYCELHHVVLKSQGGTNDLQNLVYLSTKAHFVAHVLLCRIYKSSQMLKALQVMQKHGKTKSGYWYTVNKTQRVICDKCNSHFSLLGYHSHRKTCDGPPLHTCNKCFNYSFGTKERLELHKSRCNAGGKIVCPDCGIHVIKTFFPKHLREYCNKDLLCKNCNHEIPSHSFSRHTNACGGPSFTMCRKCGIGLHKTTRSKHERNCSGRINAPI